MAHVARVRAVAEPTLGDDLWLDLAADARAAVGPTMHGAGDARSTVAGVPVRVDRLAAHWASPLGDLALGRQAWGNGAAQIFTVSDVVRPLSPASVDAEFKEGVDMARWVRPFGESFEAEVLGLYDEGWGGLTRAKALLPGVDVTAFGGLLPGAPLGGLALAGDAWGAGWTVDAIWRDGDVAAAAGTSWRSPWSVTFGAEGLYNEGGYPLLPGRWWAAGVANAEVSPLVTANVGVLAPLTDAPIDRLVFGSLNASVSDESAVGIGWVDQAWYADVRSAF